MGWFSKSSSCEEVGASIAKKCAAIIAEHFRRKDVMCHEGSIKAEFLALIVIAHRLGVVFSSLPKDKITRILSGFEEILAQMGVNRIDDLFDQRGQQYFKMFNDHVAELNNGNPKPFTTELSHRFAQFCFGVNEKGLPVFPGGNPTVALELGSRANNLFVESFAVARDLIGASNPA